MCLFAANIEQPMAYFSSNTCSIFFFCPCVDEYSPCSIDSTDPIEKLAEPRDGRDKSNQLEWERAAKLRYFLTSGSLELQPLSQLFFLNPVLQVWKYPASNEKTFTHMYKKYIYTLCMHDIIFLYFFFHIKN